MPQTPQNAEKLKTLRILALAIVETVRETGKDGAPAGPLYAALMEHGINYYQFETMMTALVQSNLLTKRGLLYFATKSTKDAESAKAEQPTK